MSAATGGPLPSADTIQRNFGKLAMEKQQPSYLRLASQQGKP